MIDDPTKAKQLLNEMRDALPLAARPTPELIHLLRQRNPHLKLPKICPIVEVFYMGDEGGVCCRLGYGEQEQEEPVITSITHLAFDKRCPVFRQIDAYQRHRIKKLKKQQGRGY